MQLHAKIPCIETLLAVTYQVGGIKVKIIITKNRKMVYADYFKHRVS